tara:strand:- start:518 stop:787 length:270 start_codon:yes stop_codon:yes gene_type:complete
MAFKSDKQRKAMFAKINGIRVSNINPIITSNPANLKTITFKRVTGNKLAINKTSGRGINVEALSKDKALVRSISSKKRRIISNKVVKFI